jgi:hypothetical protein
MACLLSLSPCSPAAVWREGGVAAGASGAVCAAGSCAGHPAVHAGHAELPQVGGCGGRLFGTGWFGGCHHGGMPQCVTVARAVKGGSAGKFGSISGNGWIEHGWRGWQGWIPVVLPLAAAASTQEALPGRMICCRCASALPPNRFVGNRQEASPQADTPAKPSAPPPPPASCSVHLPLSAEQRAVQSWEPGKGHLALDRVLARDAADAGGASGGPLSWCAALQGVEGTAGGRVVCVCQHACAPSAAVLSTKGLPGPARSGPTACPMLSFAFVCRFCCVG